MMHPCTSKAPRWRMPRREAFSSAECGQDLAPSLTAARALGRSGRAGERRRRVRRILCDSIAFIRFLFARNARRKRRFRGVELYSCRERILASESWITLDLDAEGY